MWKRLTNVAWWLGVSVYFGGMVALGAVAAPVIFETTKASAMTMPGVVSPPLSMDTEVGGEIFGAIMNRFATVEVVALFLMLVGVGGFLWAHRPIRWSTWVILLMWLALGAVLQYDLTTLRPRVWELHDKVRQEAAAHVADGAGAATQTAGEFQKAHAADGALAPWPDRAEFMVLHARAEELGHIKVYLLLGMILVSAWRGLADGPAKHKRGATLRMREEG